jgi:hypothetical protein
MFCTANYAGGADANLPSVLRDNAAIRQQWTAFLLSLLMDCSSSSSSRTATDGSSGSNGGGSSRLTVQQATAAAVFLLLQDRVDEAEEVLTAGGCWGQPGGQQLATGPLSMQVIGVCGLERRRVSTAGSHPGRQFSSALLGNAFHQVTV